MNRDLYRVRRLIKAGRYREAQMLLKETSHPDVQRLENELEHLLAEGAHVPPFVTSSSLLGGVIFGAVFTLFTYFIGMRDPAFLVMCFGSSLFVGAVLPEIGRRRQETYEMFYDMWKKRGN